MAEKQKIIIIGGASFIARHMLKQLVSISHYDIKVGYHNSFPSEWNQITNLKFQRINLFDIDSLSELIVQDSIVLNFVYLNTNSENDNIRATQNLLQVCQAKRIKRLIHCSTAVVCGRSHTTEITEETICLPFSDYEKTKYQIENIILEFSKLKNIEACIVRPTCVFGENGKNLNSIITSILHGNSLINYFKASLYGDRKLNLVRVGKVVSAISYLINLNAISKSEICIVSDDVHTNNNYRYVENLLIKKYKLNNYYLPRIMLPNFIFYFLMKIFSKSSLHKNRIYLDKRLRELGWTYNNNFDQELNDYVDSFCKKSLASGNSEK